MEGLGRGEMRWNGMGEMRWDGRVGKGWKRWNGMRNGIGFDWLS